jgi:AcrR family transcriptional regulator
LARSSKRARQERQAKARQEKRTAARDELIRGALATLSDLGYAQTSLRDIAEQTGRSVGLVHYYFEDKADLIIACVRLYKTEFVEVMRGWLTPDEPPALLQRRFVEGLVGTIREDAPVHRLWYDIRSQALFDPQFSEPVEAIEASLIDAVAAALQRCGDSTKDVTLAYLALDGAIRHALFGFLYGDEGALDVLREQAHAILGATQPVLAREVQGER